MQELQEIKKFLEGDLWEFAKYINPHYCYGEVHRKVFAWLSDPEASDHQLILLPRAHLKSHCIAVWAVWQITRDPCTTMVYLSAGEDLATVQVDAIKNMLLCDRYQTLWPEMINERENDRAKWSAYAISVDHPLRKERGIRDYTIMVKTVKSNAIGLHCSHLVLDDVVIPKFAYTEVGRKEVQRSVSQFASIKNPGAPTKAVGTRYHDADLYADFADAIVQVVDENGDVTGEEPLWDIMEAKVEDSPDQTFNGNYLWPRTLSPVDNQWYGFNAQVLAVIRGQYESLGEREQFYAQYYNDPNDPDSNRLSRDNFHYYDKRLLVEHGNGWAIKDKLTQIPNKLNIAAAMDVANTGWSEKGGNAADYTAIAVIGMDSDNNVYILDLVQFKTSDYNDYYQQVMDLHLYWGFKSITVETNSVGKQVKNALENLVLEAGLRLRVEGVSRTWKDGSKQERHAAMLEPRYRQGKVWHYKGGLIPELEEQVLLARPRHDDLEDAVCIAIETLKPPGRGIQYSGLNNSTNKPYSHPRFGGRRRR